MECERCSDDSDLRQGDILAAHPNSPNWQSGWERFFVVISADCDIAQKKTPNGLVCLPIVGLETYLGDVWIPQQARTILDSTEQKLRALVNRFAGLHVIVSDVRKMSETELLEILASAATNEGTRQGVTEEILGLQRNVCQVAELESAMVNRTETELRTRLQILFDAEKNLLGKSRAPKDVIQNALNGLSDPRRADAWPMLEMTFMDPDMRDDERHGFVVDLRRISFIAADVIAFSRKIWLDNKIDYYRMCRLRGIYKSDLIHKFANLFVRVGLEDERDAESKRRYQRLATRLSEGA